MALVNYSSSSESDIDNNCNDCRTEQNISIKKKLKSPNILIVSKGKNSENLKEMHEGKIRSFEHERGNWATYLFIPVDLPILKDLQMFLCKLLKTTNLDVKLSSDIHMSMTKTLVLRHHWINSFVKSIQNEMLEFNKFTITFESLKIFCNEEETRTFIGICINSIFTKHLKDIVYKLDTVLEEYKLEPFYNNPSFHASILWCVGDHRATLLANLNKLQKDGMELFLQESENFELKVTTLYCKIGNKMFNFSLK